MTGTHTHCVVCGKKLGFHKSKYCGTECRDAAFKNRETTWKPTDEQKKKYRERRRSKYTTEKRRAEQERRIEVALKDPNNPHWHDCKNCGKRYLNKRFKFNEGVDCCSKKCGFEWQEKTLHNKRHINAAKLRFSVVYFYDCGVCKRPFVARKKKTRYCSKECLFEATYGYEQWNAQEKKCKECGLLIIRSAETKGSKREFCSDKCSVKFYRKIGRHTRKHKGRAQHYGVEYENINRLKVFERDGWRCQICGKQTPKKRMGSKYSNAPELDHVIPMANGGGHLYSNVQCACKTCNAMKSNKYTAGQAQLFDSIGDSAAGG